MFFGETAQVVWDESLLFGEEGTSDWMTLQHSPKLLKKHNKQKASMMKTFCPAGTTLSLHKGDSLLTTNPALGEWTFPWQDVPVTQYLQEEDQHKATTAEPGRANDKTVNMCVDNKRRCRTVDIVLSDESCAKSLGRGGDGELEKLVPGDNYYFMVRCGEHFSTLAPRFSLHGLERPTPSPCRESLMISFGLWPLKYPIGIDIDVSKCGPTMLSWLKSFLQRKFVGRGDNGKDAKAAKASGRQSDTMDSINAEHGHHLTDENKAALAAAQDSSGYATGVVSEAAPAGGSGACSKLHVYGGVFLNLGFVDLAITALRGLKSAVAALKATAIAMVERAKLGAVTWTPTKRELELEIAASGIVDGPEDPLLEYWWQGLLGKEAHSFDPDRPLSASQIASMKNIDPALDVVITLKQLALSNAALKSKSASTVLASTKFAGQTGWAVFNYYLLVASSEAFLEFIGAKGLGAGATATMGPLKNALPCMAVVAKRLGQSMVKKMGRKSPCQRTCTMPYSEAELALDPSLLVADDGACRGIPGQDVVVAGTRPVLPQCTFDAGRRLFSKAKAPQGGQQGYCLQCQAAGETCARNADCATGVCYRRVCREVNLAPGRRCRRDLQCASGNCYQKRNMLTLGYKKSEGACAVAGAQRCRRQDGVSERGGCPCKTNADCEAGRKCVGERRLLVKTIPGVCEGPPPPPPSAVLATLLEASAARHVADPDGEPDPLAVEIAHCPPDLAENACCARAACEYSVANRQCMKLGVAQAMLGAPAEDAGALRQTFACQTKRTQAMKDGGLGLVGQGH